MRVVCRAAIVAVIAIGFTIVVPPPAHAADASAESAFVGRINALRASKGLSQLRTDRELVAVARSWTDQMLAGGRLAHNPDLASDVDANWIKLGENVGRGANIDQLMQAFINSPEHYRNLVDPSFDFIGVGVSYDADGRMYTTHDFMSLADAPAPSPPREPDPEPLPPPPPPPPPAEPQRVRTVLVALLDAGVDPSPTPPRRVSLR